jgi:hypothetical protein
MYEHSIERLDPDPYRRFHTILEWPSPFQNLPPTLYRNCTSLRDQALSLISFVQYRTVASRTQTDTDLEKASTNSWPISSSYLTADLSCVQEKAYLLEERTTWTDHDHLIMTLDQAYMTTIPTTSKGKVHATSRGRDWRVPDGEAYPSQDGLAQLRCPFPLEPLTVSTIPGEFLQNLNTGIAPHLVPWTGYYMIVDGIVVTIASAYGIWFKLLKRANGWKAIRVTRPSFKLNNWPMEGLDLLELERSGEPPPSRGPTLIPDVQTAPSNAPQKTSKTPKGRRPRSREMTPLE